MLAGLGRRIYLTYKYNGLSSILYRVLTFPLRYTPLRRHLRLEPRALGDRAVAARWYRRAGRHVTIVIPSRGDAGEVARLVASIRKTTRESMVRIVVPDDASGEEHLAALRRIGGIDVLPGAERRGSAATINRGLAAAQAGDDVVILEPSTEVLAGWLASLQYATDRDPDVGVVGAKVLGADGRVESAGLVRDTAAPERFAHRFSARDGDWGPAHVVAPVLAVSDACMYVRRSVLDQIGPMGEAYGETYDVVDYCLRAWEAGWRVLYWSAARVIHHELEPTMTAAPTGDGQRRFWQRWQDFFDGRDVRAADGGLHVIYVTEDTGVGGGHRDIFEHVNGLRARGHHPEVWSLAGQPGWFDLGVDVRRFGDYDELIGALSREKAIKVATWWNTAAPVWQASVLQGIPVYFVQDIETSYYPNDEAVRDAVVASYRHEFRYMTISGWNRDFLAELGLEAKLIPPGIDLARFRRLPGIERRKDMVLALGRSQPLKNLPLTIAAWRALAEPRPELCLFGIEPGLVAAEPGVRYVEAPSDAEVNELFNAATVFVQTSIHEGFCLPPLESMATGGAVVCTDAHGNRDFCRDGENCLIPASDAGAVASALARVLSDPLLRDRLGTAGKATAAEYAWSRRLDALEDFLGAVAAQRRVRLRGRAAPSDLPAAR